MAWRSFWGFQSLSKMMTVSAVARLTPRPPARVDKRKQKSCRQHKKQFNFKKSWWWNKISQIWAIELRINYTYSVDRVLHEIMSSHLWSFSVEMIHCLLPDVPRYRAVQSLKEQEKKLNYDEIENFTMKIEMNPIYKLSMDWEFASTISPGDKIPNWNK